MRLLSTRLLRILQRVAKSRGEDCNSVDALCKVARSMLTDVMRKKAPAKKSKKKPAKKKPAKKKTKKRR